MYVPPGFGFRERERERRLEAKEAHGYKKSKLTRDRDRDISEKIALGMAKVRTLFAPYYALTSGNHSC